MARAADRSRMMSGWEGIKGVLCAPDKRLIYETKGHCVLREAIIYMGLYPSYPTEINQHQYMLARNAMS
jgi:hypothetical protein